MDLRTFFNTYYKEDLLYRALIWYDREFNSLDAFIEFKMDNLNDEAALKNMVSKLLMAEIKVVERLFKEESKDNLYYVDKDQLPALSEFQYAVETSTGLVTHREIIEAVHEALINEGLMSDVKMMLDDADIEAPRDIYKLKPIYNGNIFWLYDNLTSRHLRDIIHQLNITDYGSYKDKFIESVVYYLTTKDHLTHTLSLLPSDVVALIKENADKNIHIYENKTVWYEAKSLGILVQVHRDYLVMHKDVLKVIQSIDLSNIQSVEENTYYNGYELTFTVRDLDSITRTVIIPTRLNMLELIEVIKASFIWENNDSVVKVNHFEINESNNGLNASYVQVDALLTEFKQFTFHYNSTENYTVDITLNRTVITDHFSPRITKHTGDTPLDNIGSIEDVKNILTILQDKTHPDYTNAYERARKRNYRERYPVTAINAHLARTIHEERVLNKKE